MADWIESSYMARSGLAKAKVGKTHELTAEKQGKYHYGYGPYSEPVLTIDPGDVVVVETHDAFEGAIKSERETSPPNCSICRSSIRNAVRSPCGERKKATPYAFTSATSRRAVPSRSVRLR
jgi:hypothetical protein